MNDPVPAVVFDEVPVTRAPGKGKGLGWNRDELFALSKAGYKVGSTVTGYGQKAAVFAERIRNEFIQSELRPADACTEAGTKSALDRRRWEGRGASACLRGYKDILRQCTTFYKMRKSVEAMELAGNPSDMDLYRITMAMFNGFLKPSPTPALCGEIVKNPEFVVGKPFKYMSCYKFLMSKPILKGIHGMDIMKPDPSAVAVPEGGAVEAVEDMAVESPLASGGLPKPLKRLKRSLSFVGDSERADKVADEGADARRRELRMEEMKLEEKKLKLDEQRMKLDEQRMHLDWYRAAFENAKGNVPAGEMERAEKMMREKFFEMMPATAAFEGAAMAGRVLPDVVNEHSLLSGEVRGLENGAAERVMHLDPGHHA